MTSGAGDFRLAWRGLLRARTLAAAAILTLAVGIAGTLLGFGLVNGILLRPLAVLDQDRVVVAWTEIRSRGVGPLPFVALGVEVTQNSSRLLDEVAGVG